MYDNRPIGVIDSGVGGLTVAKEFRKVLPRENIIYFGDNANVPYGNKSEEEIYRLTKNMVDYLIDKDVKLIAVACNTISSIIDKYFMNYSIPVVSIIKPAAKYVIEKGLDSIGVMATKFTIESGTYERLIKEGRPSISVVSESLPTLAGIIDRGNFTDEEVEDVVNLHMSNILEKGQPRDIILGCTHYPIVLDKFEARSGDINFIDPANVQVNYIKDLMEERSIVGDNLASKFYIYTSGQEEVYRKMLGLLAMESPDGIYGV